jgi:hypothetical protein
MAYAFSEVSLSGDFSSASITNFKILIKETKSAQLNN